MDDDLRRFYRSHVAASKHYDTAAHTVVLYRAGIVAAPDTLDRGSAVYPVRQVFLDRYNGEAVLGMRGSPRAIRWRRRSGCR